jgi:hypothetical protein
LTGVFKRLGLDVPPGTRPPHEQHIVLLDRAESRGGAGAAGRGLNTHCR